MSLLINPYSKLVQPEELDIFVEYTPKLKASEYNSPEYHQNLAEMKVALDHHYAHNLHHPQFHAEGVMDSNRKFADKYLALTSC